MVRQRQSADSISPLIQRREQEKQGIEAEVRQHAQQLAAIREYIDLANHIRSKLFRLQEAHTATDSDQETTLLRMYLELGTLLTTEVAGFRVQDRLTSVLDEGLTDQQSDSIREIVKHLLCFACTAQDQRENKAARKTAEKQLKNDLHACIANGDIELIGEDIRSIAQRFFGNSLEEPANTNSFKMDVDSAEEELTNSDTAPQCKTQLEILPGGFVYRNKTYELKGKPLQVLKVMCAAKNKTCTERTLLETIWRNEDRVSSTVRSHISKVRQALIAAVKDAGIAFQPDYDPIPLADHSNGATAWKLLNLP